MAGPDVVDRTVLLQHMPVFILLNLRAGRRSRSVWGVPVDDEGFPFSAASELRRHPIVRSLENAALCVSSECHGASTHREGRLRDLRFYEVHECFRFGAEAAPRG